MSVEQEERIKKLEKRMLELHERLESEQEEKAKALKDKEAAEKKAGKKDWFSAPMITAYLAVLGMLGNYANDWHSNIQQKIEQAKYKEKDVKAGDAVIEYVDTRIKDVADICNLYLDAVMEAMPNYQRNRVEKYIENVESGEKMPKLISHPAPQPEAPRDISSHDRPKKDKVIDKPMNASAPVEDISPFGHIFQQIEQDGEVDLEKVMEKSKSKRPSLLQRKK